jgi:sporulation protein YlmC with PRC-barrel domain
MATDRMATLVRLTDTEKAISDPADDIRGRTVCDRNGQDLGSIEDLLIDSAEGKVRLLRVESDGILGLGATSTFIPVEAVREISDEKVRIDRSADVVAGAPRYDPEVVDASETGGTEYYRDVYNYYGYPPFWAPGYVPPGRSPLTGRW